MTVKKISSLFSKIIRNVSVFEKNKLKKFNYELLSLFFGFFESLTGQYFTFQIRPMRADEILIDLKKVNDDYSEFAIVMQGPINKLNNFTLETLKLYRRYFPNALIILSTWEDEDAQTINLARNFGIEVLLNKKPDIPGFFNVNMQLITAMAGLRLAEKMNKKYVMKTRTDQRVYNEKSLIFMSNLLKDFPLEVSGFRQRGRLIGIGAYNYDTKPKPYHFFDNLIFGYTEDVMSYFGADFISDNPEIEFLKDRYPDCPFTAEISLFTEFLKKIGYKIGYTPEDYLKSLARHCILVDARSLGWYWLKYRRFIEYQNLGLNYRNKSHFSFVEWLNLYNHYK